MKKLSQRQIAQKASELQDWIHEFGSLEKDFVFKDFKSAIAFVNAVAEIAEKLSHHPDIIVYGYKNVKIMTTTHEAKGLTDKDFEIASAIDNLA